MKKKKAVDWRKPVFAIVALLVIFSTVVAELIIFLQPLQLISEP